MRRTCFLLLMCLFAVAPREAGATLVVASNLTHDESPYFRWEYALGIEFDQEIRSGAAFTIYDFAGFVPGSDNASQTEFLDADTPFPTPAQTWVFSFDLFGGTPDAPPLEDDELFYNLTWTYTGTDTLRGDEEGEQETIGYFSAQSAYEDGRVDWFGAAAYVRDSEPTVPLEAGLVFNSTEALLVPSGPEAFAPAPIPEPGTMFLLGTGLLGAWRLRQRLMT